MGGRHGRLPGSVPFTGSPFHADDFWRASGYPQDESLLMLFRLAQDFAGHDDLHYFCRAFHLFLHAQEIVEVTEGVVVDRKSASTHDLHRSIDDPYSGVDA